MPGKGGRREGAGRPTDAALALKRAVGSEQQAFVMGARTLLPKVLATLEAMADGIWVEWCTRCRQGVEDCECFDPSKVKLYRRPPDKKALELLAEYGHGKAAQAAQAAADTSIQLICNVPRPEPAGKGKG